MLPVFDLQTALLYFIPACFMVLFGGWPYAVIWLAFVFFSGLNADGLLFLLLLLLPFVAANGILKLLGAKK